MMATALVTGASGFAGSLLLELLESTEATVFAWHRPGSTPRINRSSIRWQPVDVTDRNAVARAITDSRPDAIYHLAGAAHVAQSWNEPRETLATNVVGTHHILDALRRAGLAARVLVPGSAYVYKQSNRPLSEDDPTGPASPYALSKLAQEMLGRRGIIEDGQRVFLTRSFNHTGPRQDPSYAAPGFARQIALIESGRMAPTIEVGNLDAIRDLTDVRDTVRAYQAILEKGRAGVVYNVCSGRAVAIREVLDRLAAMSRSPVRVQVDPGRYRPSDIPILVGNPKRLQRDTGWAPSITLDRTLSDLLDYWRKEVQ